VPINAVDAITPALQHARQQLVEPFRLGQWAKLALVGLLAGELSSGGGCNGGNFHVPAHTGGSNRLLETGLSNIDPALYGGLIAFLTVIGIGLLVLFLYVNSVMRFILFDSVIAKECRIREGWNRRQQPGLRYFYWQLLLILGSVASITILVGIPAGFAFLMGWLKAPKEHLIPLILGGMVLFFLLLGFIVAQLVVQVMSKDFVIPQMALEGVGAIEGWRRLWPQLLGEKGAYAGYLGMKIVMAIAAAIVIGIATLIVFLVILIPIGGFGAIALIAGKAAGLTWNLYTISLLVIVGCMALFVLIYAISLMSVPAIVFFPAYSIYFFAARYPALSVLLYPPPAAPPPPPPMPTGPPAPEPIG
jgi:hypothetical protein